MKKRYGLMGYPVAHSKSPELFREAYRGKYAYDLLEERDFDRAWGRFLDGYAAVNVTAPHKSEAFRRADKASEECRILEAANVLVKRENGIVEAYNTDWMAVKEILSERRPAGPILVVGAGGAGRAATLGALRQGYEVFLANRTFSKAEEFAERLGLFNKEWSPHPCTIEEIGDALEYCDTIIWCIPESLPLKIKGLDDTLVIEANYRNPVLSEAKNYVDGMEWLRAQARACFPIMTGSQF